MDPPSCESTISSQVTCALRFHDHFCDVTTPLWLLGKALPSEPQPKWRACWWRALPCCEPAAQQLSHFHIRVNSLEWWKHCRHTIPHDLLKNLSTRVRFTFHVSRLSPVPSRSFIKIPLLYYQAFSPSFHGALQWLGLSATFEDWGRQDCAVNDPNITLQKIHKRNEVYNEHCVLACSVPKS